MKKENKFFVAVSAFSTILLGIAVVEEGSKGISLTNNAKADLNYGVNVSTQDFNETFTKDTNLGNPITFHFANNTLKNETKLTGLSKVTFASSNEKLVIATGVKEGKYLFERTVVNDGSNNFNVTLSGECYVSISSLSGDGLNISGLDFSYTCSQSEEVNVDSRLKFEYLKDTNSYAVLKDHGFTSTDKNKECVIPSYYDDGVHGELDVTQIKDLGFNASYMEKLYIPSSVTSIGYNAFYQCVRLNTVYMGDGVTTIGHDAFASCSKLTDIRLSENLKNLDSAVFFKCKALESIHLPDSIETMSTSIFDQCSVLKNVNCPLSLSELMTSTFYHTDELKTFTITANITKLAVDVFRTCSSLECIYYQGTTSNWNKLTTNAWYSGCPLLTKVICSDGEVSL